MLTENRVYVHTRPYRGFPLTYARLKTLSADDLRKALGAEVYDSPIKARPVSLSNHPFEKFHATIRASKSLKNAATKLGVTSGTLGRYIGRITYEGSLLTYKHLRALSADDFRKAWGAEVYDMPLKIRSISPGDYPLKKIHATIRASKSLYGAATELGVKPNILGRYIGRIAYKGSLLTYERLKVLPADKLRASLGSYFYDTPKNSWESTATLEKAAVKPEGRDMTGETDSDSTKPDYWDDYMDKPAALLTSADVVAFMPDETILPSTDREVSIEEETLSPWDRYMARKARALSPTISSTALFSAVSGIKRTRSSAEDSAHGAAATGFELPNPPPREKKGRHAGLFLPPKARGGAGDGPLLPCEDLAGTAVYYK